MNYPTIKTTTAGLYIIFLFILLLPVRSFAVNLEVPFTPQAPDGRWVEPFRNACEETSTLLVELFYFDYDKKTVEVDYTKKRIQNIIQLENGFFGFNKDTDATQMTEFINQFLPWEAHLVENPSIEQIKEQIDLGQPVIIPAHGRDLHNPYYRSDQIDYHVFVVSGYDDTTKEFIVQEPATQHGLDYHYPYDTMMNAIHDFIPRDQTYRGRKVVIFTQKEISDSKNTDIDKDGLTKEQELIHKTIIWLADSDGDGFSDGNEVINGYSPTVAESELQNGALIKITSDPRVFLLENDNKRHIISESVFAAHGWDVHDIITISERYSNRFSEGEDIVN